jgi:hypothetical protein
MPTLTVPEQRAAVAANRERDEEAYWAWEYQRARRDEVTDQTERLAGAAMVNHFEYTLTPKGLMSDLGELVLPIFEKGYTVAQHQAQFDSHWQFEVTQREIEVGEQREIEAFAQANGSGVRITSLSLDKSDYGGMRAIAEKLGHQLPSERPSSEDILRNRLWVPEANALVVLSPCPDAVRVDGIDIGAYDKDRLKMIVRIVTLANSPEESHKHLINLVRDTYDATLADQYGGEWFAGQSNSKVKDALAFIESHPSLMDDHMKIVMEVHRITQDKKERLRLLKDHRYDLSAAYADVRDGKQVTSLSDSGDSARAEGKTFPGDCPTAEQAEQSTTADQLDKLGYRVELPEQILKCVNCPFCKRVVDAKKINKPKEKSIECLSCFKKIDLVTGERIDNAAKRVVKKVGAFAARQVARVKPKKSGDIVEIGGVKMRYEERLVVGGTASEYVNLGTGMVVDSKQINE